MGCRRFATGRKPEYVRKLLQKTARCAIIHSEIRDDFGTLKTDDSTNNDVPLERVWVFVRGQKSRANTPACEKRASGAVSGTIPDFCD
jgi:hypothetical protein